MQRSREKMTHAQQAQGYRTILLRAFDEASVNRTLSATVGLGRAFGAHIVGLATLPGTIPVPAGTPRDPDVVALDSRRRAAEVEQARMLPYFRRSCDAEALTSQWIVADHDDHAGWDAAWQMVRSADLIVAPTPAPARMPTTHACDSDHLLLGAGRPLLLLPRGAALETLPERIIVAWDGSREAARAMFDALPLLRLAQSITLIFVAARRGPSAAASATLMAQSLNRHGVPVLIDEIDVAVPEVGATLLAAAKAEGSELLVMGGFGRSRLSELVLGGTTRHVLRYAHLPVLISH